MGPQWTFLKFQIVAGGNFNIHLDRSYFDFYKDQGVNVLTLHMFKALRVKQWSG